MDKITTVGIDLAKRVFALHGVDASGRVVLRKTVRREQFVEPLAKLPPCLIGLEACSGSRALAQKDVGRTFARDVLRAFIAQSMHIDVVQEMLPGTE